ncbi:MAG: hydrogenase maturation nickel metallochaperone HypA [bacterium]
MDGLTVTREILKQLIEKAQSEGASRITRIEIEVGELSGLDTKEIQTHFENLSQDTLAQGAKLSIIPIPLKVRCLSCSTEYNAGGFKMTCSHCGSISSELISGNELRVKEMEVG